MFLTSVRRHEIEDWVALGNACQYELTVRIDW
jgi:hypothetical protein